MIPLKDFANWFKMFPPDSATAEEWEIFEQNCKTKFPIRYWLNEEFIPSTWDYVKNSVVTFGDKLRHYIVERLHMINIKLPPGYYGVETRILFGMFSLLVDFVEQECGWMNEISQKDRGLTKKKWYERFTPFKGSREQGLQYLDWEIGLAKQKTKDIGEKSVNTSQSENAKKVKELYLWWKDERPKREDPYKKMEDPSFERGKSLSDWLSKDDPKREEILKEVYELEKKYNDEDTKMLTELIKIRNSLWT